MSIKFVSCAILAAAIGFSAPAAFADNYPDKPIRLVVPWTSGSGSDVVGRIVAQKLGEVLKQSVYIDNRPGASGTIGSAAVVRDPADGYTLVLGNSASHGSAKAVFPNLSYDPVNDFTPISKMYKNSLVLAAHKDVPANTLPELVAYAKQSKVKLKYGTPGRGTPHLLAGETLNEKAGIKLVHVPYKGGGQATADLVAGHIQLAVISISSAVEMAKSGRIKILGVTGDKRIDSLPNIPTLSETYPGIDIGGWGGLFGPKNLPAPIVEKLNTALKTALSSDEVKTKLAAAGIEPISSTPAQLKALVQDEMEQWSRISDQ